MAVGCFSSETPQSCQARRLGLRFSEQPNWIRGNTANFHSVVVTINMRRTGEGGTDRKNTKQ